MECIVLAGGKGTRLRSVVSEVPKPMAPISGVPFLKILFDRLVSYELNRIILSVGYKADIIKNYFGDKYCGVSIEYVYESSPLGTGGAIKKALARVDSETSIILNGDTYVDVDLHILERKWKKTGRPLLVGCKVEDTARYGRLLFRKNIPVAFSEKGQLGPGIINAGCYLLPKSILESFEEKKEFSFEKDFLVPSLENMAFDVEIAEGLFIDIGVPEDFFLAQELLRQ